MSIGFFIIGGVIFAIYIGFTVFNIVESNRKQKDNDTSGKI